MTALARWVVPIAGVDPRAVRRDHVHAVVCSWLDGDSHHMPAKPWSAAAASGPDGLTLVEVCTFTDDAAGRLGDAVVGGRPVRFGRHEAVVASPAHLLDTFAPDAPMDGAARDAWAVAFRTPATVRKGDRTYPLFEPHRLIRGVRDRWNALYAQDVGETVLDDRGSGSVRITDIDGRNTIEKVAGLTISGFVGRVRYATDDSEAAPVIDRLLRFAEFAGVGSYTTRGLGRIRLEPTWSGARSTT